MTFELPYGFQAVREVVMQHRAPNDAFQSYFRVKPNNHSEPDMLGGTGGFARFQIHPEDGGQKCRVESLANKGKYLRIKDGGNVMDIAGGTGPFTLFKVHKLANHIYKLESVKFPGKYIAVQPQGPAVGGGGKWCEFKILREGRKAAAAVAHSVAQNDFELPYGFQAVREVVMQHRAPNDAFQSYFRVNPNNHSEPDMHGGRGGLARFKIHPENGGQKCRVESLANQGKYLRIKDGGNVMDVAGGTGPFTLFKVHKLANHIYKLESIKFPGKYIAVQPKGPAVGGGGKWCELKILREGKAQAAGPFKNAYGFARTNTIVMQHKGTGQFQHHLRINPGNNGDADTQGGLGDWAQWEADPQDGGAKCRFKALKSGKYLRIIEQGSKVDVGGAGGGFTVFKVHRLGNGPHGGSLVKLESNHFPGKYIAVQGQTVRMGTGGPWCELQMFRKQ